MGQKWHAGVFFNIREHLISSQFFSKRNAFQIGFTPLPPPSIRKAYRTFSDNNRCRPSSRPRLSTTKLLRASLLSFSSREASGGEQHHLHFFLVFSVPRPSARIVCFALGLQRCTRGRLGLLQATSWWGHVRPCPCPGALCEGWTGWAPAYGRSPRGLSWSSGVWAVTEPDVCARSQLRKFLRNQFSFFVENVRFVIFHPKLALPPPPVSKCVTFRKKLRTYEMLPNFISKANLKNPEQGFLVHRFYLLRKQKDCLWQGRFST